MNRQDRDTIAANVPEGLKAALRKYHEINDRKGRVSRDNRADYEEYAKISREVELAAIDVAEWCSDWLCCTGKEPVVPIPDEDEIYESEAAE